MGFDLREAASRMIDDGATDEEIKGTLGAIKNYASQLMDQGKSDEEIQNLIGKTKWKNTSLFGTDKTNAAIETAANAATATPAPHTNNQENRLVKFAKEAALPTAGGVIGGAAGTLAGPVWGNAIGAGIGGAAGEALNQYLGITEPSKTDIAVSAIAPSAFRGAGIAAKKSVPILKGLAKEIPGISAVLKQPVVEEAKQLSSKFLPEVGSQELYGQLKDLPETLVKFPKTTAMMKDMAAREETIIPGLQSEAIKRGERGGIEKLTSAKPQIIDQVRQAQGYASKAVLQEAAPDAGVPFRVGQDNVRRLGVRIRNAEAGVSQEDAGALKSLRSAFIEDMDAATAHLPKLKAANNAFKTEMAVEDLQSMMENSIKAVAGKNNIYDFNAKTVLDKLNKITSPTNKKDFDRLFTEGLGDKNLKELRTFLDKVNDIGPISFSIGSGGGRTGSLVMQSIPAAAGGALGATLAGPAGAAIGAIGGAQLPGLIAEGITKPAAREFILKSFQSSGGKIADPSLFANMLGSILARTPRLAPED